MGIRWKIVSIHQHQAVLFELTESDTDHSYPRLASEAWAYKDWKWNETEALGKQKGVENMSNGPFLRGLILCRSSLEWLLHDVRHFCSKGSRCCEKCGHSAKVTLGARHYELDRGCCQKARVVTVAEQVYEVYVKKGGWQERRDSRFGIEAQLEPDLRKWKDLKGSLDLSFEMLQLNRYCTRCPKKPITLASYLQ